MREDTRHIGKKEGEVINGMTVAELISLSQREGESCACHSDDACDCGGDLGPDGETRVYPWMARAALSEIRQALQDRGY
jgi:hypothetical protein